MFIRAAEEDLAQVQVVFFRSVGAWLTQPELLVAIAVLAAVSDSAPLVGPVAASPPDELLDVAVVLVRQHLLGRLQVLPEEVPFLHHFPSAFLQLFDAVVRSLLLPEVDEVALCALDLRLWALLQVLC